MILSCVNRRESGKRYNKESNYQQRSVAGNRQGHHIKNLPKFMKVKRFSGHLVECYAPYGWIQLDGSFF